MWNLIQETYDGKENNFQEGIRKGQIHPNCKLRIISIQDNLF